MVFYNRNTGDEITVSFRPFEISDGKALRDCVADFYGNGYPYKKYLEPEFLSGKCEEGNMKVLCGFTESGEMVSVSAIRFDSGFRGSAMLLLRVVKEKYRGMGIGAAQEKLLFQELEKQKALYSDYADVMTHNAVSQGSLIRRGFVICAVRPLLYKKRIMAPGLPSSENARLSQVVMCRKESASETAFFYCPPEHKEAAARIYSGLGQPFIASDSCPQAVLEKTVFSQTDETGHGSAVWAVQEAGQDFGLLLQKEIKKCADEGTEIILCYLNVSRPGAGQAYQELSGAGFCFTGFKPLNADGEYLVMAHTGERCPDREEICLHPEGEWLLEYICAGRKRGKL